MTVVFLQFFLQVYCMMAYVQHTLARMETLPLLHNSNPKGGVNGGCTERLDGKTVRNSIHT